MLLSGRTAILSQDRSDSRCIASASSAHQSQKRLSSRLTELRRPFGSARSSCTRQGIAALASEHDTAPLVKICGVHNVEDAAFAAQSGADFIGLILWPRTKRAVSVETAASIAAAALEHGAQPVAVFVDEDADTIARVCREAGIGFAQLHGDGARSSLGNLPDSLQVIYVLHSSPDGVIQTELPPDLGQPTATDQRRIDWLLVDGLKGGSGEALNWHALNPPREHAQQGWLLAGGLNPTNVAEAVRIARPTVVDVSSGVAGTDGIAKDHAKVRAFIEAAKGST